MCVSWYIFDIKFVIFVLKPSFSSLFMRPCLHTESCAFFRSTKQANTPPPPLFVYFSIMVCNTKMWSDVLNSFRKPPCSDLINLSTSKYSLILVCNIELKSLLGLLVNETRRPPPPPPPGSLRGRQFLHSYG